MLQTRRKPATPRELEALARLGRQVTAEVGALLVVNDDVDLANRVGADAVHLGQGDLPIARARRRTDLVIGVSTHTRAQLAVALAAGADYVAYGPVFATTTKADPEPEVGLDGLRAAVELAGDTPVVAIGGITGARIAEIFATGAAASCAISWVNDAADPVARGRDLAGPWGRVR